LRRLKDLLTAMVLVALCGISLAGAYRVWQSELPGRSPDDMRDLWDLLVNEDISGYDDRALGRLAARLEMELAQGTMLKDRFSGLEEAQHDLLEGNIEALLRVWYLKHADAYGRLAGNEPARAVYVEEQVGNITLLMSAANYGGDGRLGMVDAGLRLLGLIEGWLADEPEERVANAREFNQDVLMWVMRQQPSGLGMP